MINILITLLIDAVETTVEEYLKSSIENPDKVKAENKAIVARLLEIMLRKSIISKEELTYIVEGEEKEVQLLNSTDNGRT